MRESEKPKQTPATVMRSIDADLGRIQELSQTLRETKRRAEHDATLLLILSTIGSVANSFNELKGRLPITFGGTQAGELQSGDIVILNPGHIARNLDIYLGTVEKIGFGPTYTVERVETSENDSAWILIEGCSTPFPSTTFVRI